MHHKSVIETVNESGLMDLRSLKFPSFVSNISLTFRE